jgi:hypothetical protein
MAKEVTFEFTEDEYEKILKAADAEMAPVKKVLLKGIDALQRENEDNGLGIGIAQAAMRRKFKREQKEKIREEN